MFCYQCEQRARGTGCEVLGVCGKKPEVADLQDLLLYSLMGLSQVVLEGIRFGMQARRYGEFVVTAAFSTSTNVDFDPQRFVDLIHQAVALRKEIRKELESSGYDLRLEEGPTTFEPAVTREELLSQAASVGLFSYPADNSDILSLKHTVLFGIKGVAAYADHARILGQEDDDVYHFIFKGLAAIQQTGLNLDDWLRLTLDCGKAAYRAMELLDAGNTETYGHPIPPKGPLGHKKGKAILDKADDIVAAVKTGRIRHFFLVAGCDGAKPGRSYYTEFVEKLPDDCIGMILSCGKHPFFDKDLGDIDGIPRLLDIGRCNDAYSAIQIALALSRALDTNVNDLPLSMILSWYEQKSLSILLALLYLGIQDIRLGPGLPAFFTPTVLNLLVEKFNIMPIKTPDEDIKEILG